MHEIVHKKGNRVSNFLGHELGRQMAFCMEFGSKNLSQSVEGARNLFKAGAGKPIREGLNKILLLSMCSCAWFEASLGLFACCLLVVCFPLGAKSSPLAPNPWSNAWSNELHKNDVEDVFASSVPATLPCAERGAMGLLPDSLSCREDRRFHTKIGDNPSFLQFLGS
jgi:hypothetical protein